MAFSYSYHSLLPCFCFCAGAVLSRAFSCVVGTDRSRASDPFACDGGSHYVCDESGLGSDWEYDHVPVGSCACDALVDCDCHDLWPYDPALGHVASTMASDGDGDGVVAVKRTDFLVRAIDDGEAD